MTNFAEKAFAIEVVEKLRQAGHQALWAGGCVRDILLGNIPSDYDVATSATPQQVRQLFGSRRTLPVGVSFGVVIVLGPKRSAGQVEVATFRTDATYSDGRRPDRVTFSTPQQDAQRRDFTINGMFLDPLDDQVIDYVGGQQDLERGLIRAIGRADERIAEDKLRMLRAVRFGARFGFEIEPQTQAAIAKSANEVQVVSGERIAVEVEKTLQTDRAGWAVRTWAELGLLPVILPEVSAGWSLQGTTALALLEALATTKGDWRSKMAALLWTIVNSEAGISQAVQSLKTRLKWSNDNTRTLENALMAQRMLENPASQPWSQVQPWLIKESIPVALELLLAREVVGEIEPGTTAWLQARLRQPQETLDPAPLVSGNDLMKAGVPPGPDMRRWLSEIRDRQLDGQLTDRTAALNWVVGQLQDG